MNDKINKVKKKKRKLIKRRVAFFAITFSLVILLGLGVAYFYNANRPMYAGVVLPATERGFEVVETPLSTLPFTLTEGVVLSIVLISFVKTALSLLFLSLTFISNVVFSVTV